jgi:Spy/CpxP family protein refolding chaperone
MRQRTLGSTFALVCMASSVVAASPPCPHAGPESRDIKALSPEDVSAYLSGKGMGNAKAAELNGFAGPAHVLELAAELQLSAEQRTLTEALFASMSKRASSLGSALVDKERVLDQRFATKAITRERLAEALSEIGRLQTQIRSAHLEAHLAQFEILTSEQNARYSQLRGYGGTGVHAGHEHQH